MPRPRTTILNVPPIIRNRTLLPPQVVVVSLRSFDHSSPLTTGPVPRSPALRDLYGTNGSAPCAGDRALLTTVSPNGDGFRDAAFVHFRLTRPARVAMDVVATDMIRAGRTGTSRVWHTSRLFTKG